MLFGLCLVLIKIYNNHFQIGSILVGSPRSIVSTTMHLKFTISMEKKVKTVLQHKKFRKRRNQKEIPTPKTEVGKNQTNNQVLIPRKHFVSRMASYFPNRWPLSYLSLTKNMKTHIRRQQHKNFKHQNIKRKEPPQKYRI